MPLIPSFFVQDAEMKLEQATVLDRLSEVERVVEEACGAMDDIAVSIHSSKLIQSRKFPGKNCSE